MTLDPRDAALRMTCPVESVPRFGPLEAMTSPGQRVLLAHNGVFLEVQRTWLNAVVRLSDLPHRPPLPFGEVTERVRFAFGVIPIPLLEDFIRAGKGALPNEAAGALVYSASTKKLRLVLHEAIRTSPSRINYRMPEIAADEEIAVDLHTHGAGRAFWSDLDDLDDQCVKVCGVFGRLRGNTPDAAFRLVVNGHFKSLAHPWERAKERASEALDSEERWPTLNSIGFARIEHSGTFDLP